MKKTPEEAIEILNDLTEDANQWVVENSERKKTVGVHQFDTYNTLQNYQRQQYQPQQVKKGNQSSLEEMFKSFITKVDEKFENQSASIRNLEKQVGQIKNQISERTPGTLPKKLDKCFGKFLEMLKQLHMNIPFTEVVTQMPAYAKFLKEILSSKRKLEETSVVKIISHCSAIPQNKLPQKCEVGRRAWNIKSIPMSLQLADQSTIIPEGIVEDVLVRVDKFVFPVDFIVVDMEENKEVPLILGLPFLAIGRAILHVYEGKLMLRVGEEKVVFNMKKVDELTFKTTKSNKKIMAWVRALGQACTREPGTIFNTD
ncbi:hypothetical protein R3W88_029573 [Solanum pinnatisectum]|uniref:Uncharacterized protein n=1 Tax=Solanum pinnatisectum TaxID=50273 RepID=A0AAV9K649_9SOLN|nr:hypothetical protein R3W88_029573 [Solanum pinnatisectum]